MSVVFGYNLLELVNVIVFSFQLSSAKRDLAFASFPALFDTFFTFAIGCLFSRACHWLHFPLVIHRLHFSRACCGCLRLQTDAYFPELAFGLMFSAPVIGCHWLPFFLPLSPVPCFLVLVPDKTYLPQVLFGLTSVLPQ